MTSCRGNSRCPQAVIIPPSREKYSRVSHGVMEIFRTFTPEVEPVASDEAFLDAGEARKRLGPPAAIAAMIRERVAAEHGITCSAGVANSKFVAKLASRHCKPDGLPAVPADRVVDFPHPLPVAALWGVGERTERSLSRSGIRTAGDLAEVPVETLRRELGQAVAAHLAAPAAGRDERPVTRYTPDRAMDRAVRRFGRDAVVPASLVCPPFDGIDL
ncbi:hypothetical protein [Streptosporangium sp. NPDC006007]|uniref:DNA polymerase Y family protein n=1 Tax=Streptosporangium sp. NPDC006007 TaxID=3154575 RepID=UPI0033A35FB2